MAVVHARVFVRERSAASAERPRFPQLVRTAFLVVCAGSILVHFRTEGEAFLYFQF